MKSLETLIVFVRDSGKMLVEKLLVFCFMISLSTAFFSAEWEILCCFQFFRGFKREFAVERSMLL
jgi:hypothetical protein